jgi:hypothetical protein
MIWILVPRAGMPASACPLAAICLRQSDGHLSRFWPRSMAVIAEMS